MIGWIRDKTGIAAPTADADPGRNRASRLRCRRRCRVRCRGARLLRSGVAVPACVRWSMRWSTRCVAIVAELTGYPPELLDLDLDLEADLGVDTVKQAEVFAAVRERFDVARDDSLALREFPTLTHVIGWIRDKTGIRPPAGAAAEQSRCEPAATASRGAPGHRRRRPGRRRPAPAARPGAGPAAGIDAVLAHRRHLR